MVGLLQQRRRLRRSGVQLPSPSFNFLASAQDSVWNINCLPLTRRQVLCLDQSGRNLLCDLNTELVATLPDLHRPKARPFSIFIPSANPESGGSIYVMESYPGRELGCLSRPFSYQFEAFVSRKDPLTSFPSWRHQLLPPPPYLRDPKHRPSKPIISYAVVGSGSHICMSTELAGTYCLDTAKHVWSHVGDWALPFQGKVEYVPELKLWFGISTDGQLAAADLSTILSSMDSQPQLVGHWKELEHPEEWKEVREPVLANLGSGRFCTLRFFQTWIREFRFLHDHVREHYFTVLTGADVVPSVHDCNGSGSANSGNGKVELEIIRHNSRFHTSYGSDGIIEAVF